MNDFAWILCSKEKDVFTSWGSRINSIMHKFYLKFFAKPKLYKVLEKYGTEGYLIRLPLTPKEFQGLDNKSIAAMVKKVFRVLKKSNISRLYPELCLIGNDYFREELHKKGIYCLSCGYDTFVSLTEHMLYHIAEKKHKDIGRLEITIVSGNDLPALKTMLLKLAGSVGLVTIAGELCERDKKELENWLEGICDETGLCVRTTSDVTNTVRNCDIAVSFECKPDFSLYGNKPVIWFGRKSNNQYDFYPYRIEIKFPAILYNHYTQELVSCFGSIGVAEAYLDTEPCIGKGNNFPEIERINLLKRQLYEEMEDIRYIRKPLE